MSQDDADWRPTIQHCPLCGAPIYWAILRRETRDIDAHPARDGNVLLVIRNRTLRAGFVDHELPPGAGRKRYTVHSATCTKQKI